MGHAFNPAEKLGIPQGARDMFALRATGGWIDDALARSLKRMMGFFNIAVHDYHALQLPITVSIITMPLAKFCNTAKLRVCEMPAC